MRKGISLLRKKGKAICIRCRNTIDYDHMTSDIAKNRDKEIIGVVVEDRKGKDYEIAREDDKKVFEEAKRFLKEKEQDLLNEDLIPLEEMHSYELYSITNYGLKSWYEYFNERQLLLITTLLRNIKDVCKEINDKEYAKVIATYLAFMLCKHVDRNSIGITWDASREIVSHALAFRRPGLMYNFAEVNPFEEVSGSLSGILKNITDAIEFASKGVISKVELGSALHLPHQSRSFDLIITDPPYLDDVLYGEASEFFYVWLYRALRGYYPELPARSPLDEDLILSKGRFGSKDLAFKFYKQGMIKAFKEINRVLKDDGLLVVFFAHSSTEAWNLLLEILREADLQVTASYAVHTENEENVLARGKTSFMSSIVISCRKLREYKSIYINELYTKIEDRINGLLKGIPAEKLLATPITDLLIMVYGKVLEVATEYKDIKSYTDSKPDFNNIIERARDEMMKRIVEKLTGRTPNQLGGEASFYIISKISYRGVINPDDGLKLARLYGISSLEGSKLVKKDKKGVMHLITFKDIEDNLKPEEIDRNNLHRQLLYIEYRVNKDGANSIQSILENSNFRVDDLKQIISLLIKYYGFLQNKKVSLSIEESEEFEILKSIEDMIRDNKMKRLDRWL